MLAIERTETIDLTDIGGLKWSELLAKACQLGIIDATHTPQNSELSGRAIAAALHISVWRNGHLRALRCAYMAGRFHVDTMDMEG